MAKQTFKRIFQAGWLLVLFLAAFNLCLTGLVHVTDRPWDVTSGEVKFLNSVRFVDISYLWSRYIEPTWSSGSWTGRDYDSSEEIWWALVAALICLIARNRYHQLGRKIEEAVRLPTKASNPQSERFSNNGDTIEWVSQTGRHSNDLSRFQPNPYNNAPSDSSNKNHPASTSTGNEVVDDVIEGVVAAGTWVKGFLSGFFESDVSDKRRLERATGVKLSDELYQAINRAAIAKVREEGVIKNPPLIQRNSYPLETAWAALNRVGVSREPGAGPVRLGRELLIQADLARERGRTASDIRSLIEASCVVLMDGVVNPSSSDYGDSTNGYAQADALMWLGIVASLLSGFSGRLPRNLFSQYVNELDGRPDSHALQLASDRFILEQELTKAGRCLEELAQIARIHQFPQESNRYFRGAIALFERDSNTSRALLVQKLMRASDSMQNSFFRSYEGGQSSTTICGSTQYLNLRVSLRGGRPWDSPAGLP